MLRHMAQFYGAVLPTARIAHLAPVAADTEACLFRRQTSPWPAPTLADAAPDASR